MTADCRSPSTHHSMWRQPIVTRLCQSSKICCWHSLIALTAMVPSWRSSAWRCVTLHLASPVLWPYVCRQLDILSMTCFSHSRWRWHQRSCLQDSERLLRTSVKPVWRSSQPERFLRASQDHRQRLMCHLQHHHHHQVHLLLCNVSSMAVSRTCSVGSAWLSVMM